MREIDLDFNGIDIAEIDINLKILYYFAVVAEAGSFTKAARELYVTQSMLSKNMILLEEHLGFPLLKRNRHSLELTQKGKYLYKKWKFLIKQYRNDIHSAQEIGQIGTGRLRLGCFPALDVLDFMQDYTEKLSALKPEIFIEILRMNPNRLFEHLHSNQVDLIFVYLQDIPASAENFEWIPARQLPLVALMRADHPLSASETISFSDLSRQTILLSEPGGRVSRKNWFQELCAKYHTSPHSVITVNNDLTAQLNAANGHGIAVGLSCVYGKTGNRLKAVPIAEEKIDIAGVWLKETSKELKSLYHAILT